jgi:hypothetical protein
MRPDGRPLNCCADNDGSRRSVTIRAFSAGPSTFRNQCNARQLLCPKSPTGAVRRPCILVRGSAGDLFDTWRTTPILTWEWHLGNASRGGTVDYAQDTILTSTHVDTGVR